MQEKTENRGSPRYNILGKVVISGLLESGIMIKNLSVTGCCLISAEDINSMKIGEVYMLKIKPENADEKDEFELNAECVWIRKIEKTDENEIGFTVAPSHSGKHFQNYVSYVTSHTV